MATYINGVTDFIPQIQEFQPDFNFYAKSLQMSQSKYDANHEKLSNLYGSLLNAPMLREKNIEARDAFFKVIDQDIQKIASMDLSKQQNVDAASSLFNQMIDNKNIVKDMTWTKNWQNEHQRADGFRNCIDPKKCGGSWWEEGVTALNYMAEEFKSVNDEEAMNFGNARFTPYQDVMGKAVALAKEADLSIKIDQRSGGFIVTTKNGPNLAKPLASLFMGTLAKDPAVMDYYRTKAYVTRKGAINSMINVYGSEEAATNEYIKQLTQKTKPELDSAEAQILYNQSNVSEQKKALEKKITEEGTTANSTLADVYRRMVSTEQNINSSSESIQDATGNLKVGLSSASKSALRNLDNALASTFLQNDIAGAANTLAYKDYERTLAVDPYAMESVQQANRLVLEDKKFQKNIALEQYKFDLKQLDKKIDLRGDALDNEGLLIDVTTKTGDVTTNVAPTAFYDQFIKTKDNVQQAISRPEREMLIDAMSLAINASDHGDAGASADLLSIGDALVNNLKADDPAFINRYKNLTPEAKLKALKSMDFANGFQKLPGTTADELYTNVLLPMLDTKTNKDNAVTRKYMSQLWTTPAAIEKRNRIGAKSATLANLDKYYKEQVSSVKAKMKTDSRYDGLHDAIDLFIDENGNQKSQKEFAMAYAADVVKNIPKDQAPDFFAGPANKRDIAKQAYSEAVEIYNNMNDEEGVMTLWKEAFSNHAVAKGQTSVLGGGSFAAEKALNFPTADPAKTMSGGIMGFNTFVNDVRKSTQDQARVVFGDVSAGIPEENNADALSILNQIQSDVRTRTKKTDASRPILNLTYHNIAGGNNDWTAVNVKIDDTYAKQYIGTKDNQGLLYDRRTELQKDGITLYLKKDAASNMFYNNAKTTDIETILDYNGQYPIDEHPDIARNTVLKKLDNGYMISGDLAYDLDQNGNVLYQPFTNQYYDPQTNVNTVIEQFRQGALASSVKAMLYKQAIYNATAGIKNPIELLNQ